MKQDVVEMVGTRYHKRLLALANHIEKVPQELFDMGQFRSKGEFTLNHCGTVGCILGHAPVVLKQLGLAVPVKIERDEIDFIGLSTLFGIRIADPAWDYLFGGSWESVDNTPTGAARRIRWVVKHGVPNTWRNEANGLSALSYM